MYWLITQLLGYSLFCSLISTGNMIPYWWMHCLWYGSYWAKTRGCVAHHRAQSCPCHCCWWHQVKHIWKLIGVDACTVGIVENCFLITPAFLPPGHPLLGKLGFVWCVRWVEKIKPLKSYFAVMYLLFFCIISSVVQKVDPQWTIVMLISNLWKIKDTFRVFTDTSFILDSDVRIVKELNLWFVFVLCAFE